MGTNYTAALTYDRAQGIFLRSDNSEVTGRAEIRHSMFNDKLDADLTFLNRERIYFNGPDYGCGVAPGADP